jgi:glycosyltransferase involved in cell wall biosynthesis
LREAIDSLERQSNRPDEVLIIDDASTDDSETVLQELEAKGYRVVRNEKNLGIVGNFNKAVSLTKADYIFFLGGDNRLRSDYLLELRTALDHSTSIAVAYSDMTIFGPLSRKLAKAVGAEPIADKRMENETIYHWRFPEPQGEALENFAKRNFVHGSSMYRRSFYEKVGGYKLTEGPEDHNLFYRMWRAGGGLIHVAKPLLEYRQHSVSQANTALSAALELKTLRTKLEISRAAHLKELRELQAAHLKELRELRDITQSIRASRAWPLIRIIRPLRKRFKRVGQLIEDALKHASA